MQKGYFDYNLQLSTMDRHPGLDHAAGSIFLRARLRVGPSPAVVTAGNFRTNLAVLYSDIVLFPGVWQHAVLTSTFDLTSRTLTAELFHNGESFGISDESDIDMTEVVGAVLLPSVPLSIGGLSAASGNEFDGISGAIASVRIEYGQGVASKNWSRVFEAERATLGLQPNPVRQISSSLSFVPLPREADEELSFALSVAESGEFDRSYVISALCVTLFSNTDANTLAQSRTCFCDDERAIAKCSDIRSKHRPFVSNEQLDSLCHCCASARDHSVCSVRSPIR